MPFQTTGAPRPIVTVTTTTSTGAIENVARTVDQAIDTASQAIEFLVGSPSEGFPANAVPGRFYTFASQPDAMYTLGRDFIWRAVVLVRV